MKKTSKTKILMGFLSLLFLSPASGAAAGIGVERHPENNNAKAVPHVQMDKQKEMIVKNYEDELATIYKSTATLEEKKEKVPRDSARYVDLDKNIVDIYMRTQLAEKYVKKMKDNPAEVSDKNRDELEFLLSDTREIINWNAQPSE